MDSAQNMSTVRITALHVFRKSVVRYGDDFGLNGRVRCLLQEMHDSLDLTSDQGRIIKLSGSKHFGPGARHPMSENDGRKGLTFCNQGHSCLLFCIPTTLGYTAA